MSEEEFVRTYLMPVDEEEEFYQIGFDLSKVAADKAFDGRDEFGDCIHPIRDQGSCGSCWAFATSEVASDRACIDAKNEKYDNLIFSPQYLVDCDKVESGCNGAATQRVIGWIAQNGIALDSCYPYEARNGVCRTETLGCKKFTFKDDKIWQGTKANVEELQKALKDGPLYFSMQVKSGFQQWNPATDFIYQEAFGSSSLGGHAVKALGWGTDAARENDPKFSYIESHYWIVANSWGPRWGDAGFFRIYMNATIGYNAGYLRFDKGDNPLFASEDSE